jgi:VanZ family protein
MFYLENNPGEKFHLIQYGIFGLLVFLSLEEFQEFSEKKKYLLSFIISLLAGGIDEGIQGLLPNRTFTWHDVFINFLSSFLVFHLFYIIKRELKKISIYDE